jgi:hypothetical protein
MTEYRRDTSPQTPITRGMSWPVDPMVFTPDIEFHRIISSIDAIDQTKVIGPTVRVKTLSKLTSQNVLS